MLEKSSDIANIFGKSIKELRLEKGFTQEKLAENSGLHTNYISLLERGKRKPTINTVFKIAAALEIKPHQLIIKIEDKLR
ncbi:MAG TPA: helix-turn-helix transcriptional regulator [Balneolaceae bacterium]